MILDSGLLVWATLYKVNFRKSEKRILPLQT